MSSNFAVHIGKNFQLLKCGRNRLYVSRTSGPKTVTTSLKENLLLIGQLRYVPRSSVPRSSYSRNPFPMEPLGVYSVLLPKACCSNQTRYEARGMSVFHHTDKKRRRLTTNAEGRLPPGLALLVIGGLSALSWVVLIALFMALRAIV